MRLAIKGGKVFDPSSGRDGGEQDLFIEDGRVVAELNTVDQVINAKGLAVTPAAIDLRSSVAGYGQNFLRLWGALPSPREIGKSYALLGYTHIHEPFLTLQTANYVHRELAAVPIVDTSASLTLNLRDFDIPLKNSDQLTEISAAWAYLMEHNRALNLRLTEPFVRYRQDFYRHRALSTECIMENVVRIAGLLSGHLTIEANPEVLSVDLPSHPEFHLSALGPALASDALLEKALAYLEGGGSGDMGLLPPTPRPGTPPLPIKMDLNWFEPFNLNALPATDVARRALQLAVQGRKENLAFSAADLMQTPLSSFPLLFSWLGENNSRQRDWGQNLPMAAYSMQDWLRSTRTLPARYLGLTDRGHLRPGARADVALYDFPGRGTSAAWQESCSRCRMLLKAGELVVNNFAVVHFNVPKATYYRRTQANPSQMVTDLLQNRSFRRENLGVQAWPDIPWQQVP